MGRVEGERTRYEGRTVTGLDGGTIFCTIMIGFVVDMGSFSVITSSPQRLVTS